MTTSYLPTPEIHRGPLFRVGQATALELIELVDVGTPEEARALVRRVMRDHGHEGLFSTVSFLVVVTFHFRDGVPVEMTVVDTLTMTKVDVDEVPPAGRAVGRIAIAIMNDDIDTAWAVWIALGAMDQAKVLMTFVRSATAALLEHGEGCSCDG